jgi:hypothetical protein
MNKKIRYKYQLPICSGGMLLIGLGNWLKPHPPGPIDYNFLIFTEVLIDLGIGLFVAAIVSIIFDVWYHKMTFGEPLSDLDVKVQSLSFVVKDLTTSATTITSSVTGLNLTVDDMTTRMSDKVAFLGQSVTDLTTRVTQMGEMVVNFNKVLKSTQENGIHAIYRRRTEPEIMEWKDRIRSTLTNANKYILITGRTLDDILPVRNKANGIYSILEEKAKSVPIIFLFADTFNADSDFRIEAKDRAGEHAPSLYVRTRDSITQILDLSNSISERTFISIRLLKKGPPFALFMTEKSAIIEPYLPYLEGGESIVYEIQSSNNNAVSSAVVSKNLHSAHKQCFGKLYGNSIHISDVLDEYVKQREQDRPEIVERFTVYQQIAKKLKGEEDNTIKRAELF